MCVYIVINETYVVHFVTLHTPIHSHTSLTYTHTHTQPENILLYRKGSLDIKIADFGLSVQVKEGQEMKNLVGTAEYVCKYYD